MDNALKTGLFPGYTLAELEAVAARGAAPANMLGEIARRHRVAAGDDSAMSQSERFQRLNASR